SQLVFLPYLLINHCSSSRLKNNPPSPGEGVGVTISMKLLSFVVPSHPPVLISWRPHEPCCDVGKHLVLVTDPEGAADQYAFDNPCFKDGTPIGRTTLEKEPAGKLDQKELFQARWSPWGALVGPRTADKRRALDDSFIGEPQVNVVSLRSHDFTGLGFNICGNMRDGIFVKDVLHRGPASESGRIAPGDRIDGIRISFRHMVFEDALTILSYASPYDVQLEVENASNSRPSTLIRTKRTSGSSIAPADRICHPFYRSQSIAALLRSCPNAITAIGKASLKRMQQMGGLAKSPRAEDNTDYPTLKLSTSPTDDRKRDSTKLEKTAPVVKPERVKKSPSLTQDDSLSRFPKFGVRVLPPNDTDTLPAEHQQNEQNSIIEKVSEEDGVRHKQYDERGIDIGPVQPEEPQHNTTPEPPAGSEEEESEPSKLSIEGEIPTEIPEEVRRAAMAARSNRKSSAGNVVAELSIKVQDEESYSEGEGEDNQDSLERTPKRPNKRKAPPPPEEEEEEKPPSPEASPQQKREVTEEDNIQTACVDIPEVTNITIEDKAEEDQDDKLKHMDYDIGVNVNSDSDSDAGEDKKAKKGGTTIELNSSHITIHHSPSSELENDSTRKAASLGDLSRLDSEQPMSVLERAVSLDLADGGTPHGSKKRKAPLPPPGEDYLGMPDGDEGIAHRKEPRLDSAMDTFQRRRLKKSSDWGTLEEALMQSEEKTVVCITPEPEHHDDQEMDTQPPELPTSPVPTLSSFKPSPSMTYITEIQVLTSGDSCEGASSSSQEESGVAQRVLQYNVETEPEEPEEPEPAPQKGNVTVTAIRSTASRIPTRVSTSQPSVTIAGNHVTEEKRIKPARPPVPPRKSETSEGGATRITTPGKFISFSSLTPTDNRNSTSFEQWVFLDDNATTNGLEPVPRSQSVTHIVLDAQQPNGKP
ncbi:hypothetical protein L9F63_012843, partial [Diploptera punctata]